jgi:predicted dehydrogenase
VNAIHCGKKHGFSEACTDAELSVLDPAIDTVVVATRHNLHASQILAALRAGKHVFCEKPLCLTLEELSEIVAVKSERPDLHLMVGFNRRFSPHVKMMSELLSSIREPKSFVLTVNAGEVPADHWTQDPSVGGGRLIGEACHFIDLLRHLASAPISRHRTLSLGGRRGLSFVGDVSHILLEFEDGSIGSIHYLANGHRSFPKERLEVFAAGRVLQLDNFRKLRGWGWKGFSKMALWRQDKGQLACAKSFVDSVINGLPSPIAIEEIYEVSRVSIEVANTV